MSKFKQNYYKAFQIAAKKNGMKATDYARQQGMANVSNVYVELKESAPNSLMRGLEPFKSVGASVEIVITPSDGSKIVLK